MIEPLIVTVTEHRLETFKYEIPGYETLIWIVSRAKAEIAAGHILTTVPIAREEMAGIAAQNGYDEAHLAHVDHTLPGIGAPFKWEGSIQYLLIDGTHRCVKAYRLHEPFQVQLLTDEAAARCLILGDARLRVS